MCVLCGKVPVSRIPRDFSAVVTMPSQEVAVKKKNGKSSHDKDGDANNNRGMSESPLGLKEETVWPGWENGMLH